MDGTPLPWWRRDVPFPRFWPIYPLMLVVTVVATGLFAALWEPLGPVAYCFGWLGGLVLLWGPRGLLRPTADPPQAWRQAIAAGSVALIPFVAFAVVT